jgi:hypothetical protein
VVAAGYVAAMVIPARKPRYALAAPRITDIASPRRTARMTREEYQAIGER